MKRVLLVALSVALFASVANAQGTGTIWLAVPGGGNQVNMLVSETAVVQLWMEYTSSDPYARLLGVISQLQYRTQNGVDFEVTGFQASPDLPAGLPGSQLFRASRGILDQDNDGNPDTFGLGNIDDYQFQGDVNALPAGGWSASMGLFGNEGQLLLDTIIIHGVNDTLTLSNRIMFNQSIFPRYTEGTLYGDGVIKSEDNDILDVPFGMGTGINKLVPMYVHISVPEPGSLALLAFGGLAAIRRRR
jgi:hypothetical protein